MKEHLAKPLLICMTGYGEIQECWFLQANPTCFW